MRKSFKLLVLLPGLAACLSGCSSAERPAATNPSANVAPKTTNSNSNAAAPASAAPESHTVGNSGGASANRPDAHKPTPAGIKPPQKVN
jgi:hypothetical protein